MLVYGKGSIKLSDIYNQIINALKEAKLQVIKFAGAQSNPLLSHVKACIALAKQEGIEVIIAVGGGSVIDISKATAVGAGLSIIIPGWMRYSSRKSSARFAQFAERVFGIQGNSTEKSAEKGIAALKARFEKICSPTTLTDANIPVNDIARISENAVMLAKKWKLNKYTQEVITEVLRLCC
jgi:alcohol dehydrogenase YqhD (iron-dependent ADH family)